MSEQNKDNNTYRSAIIQTGRCRLVTTNDLGLDVLCSALFDTGDCQPGCFADSLFVAVQQEDVVCVRPVPFAADLLPVRHEVLHQVVQRGMSLLLAHGFGVAIVRTMRFPWRARPCHDVEERCFLLVVAEPLLRMVPRGGTGGTRSTTKRLTAIIRTTSPISGSFSNRRSFFTRPVGVE